MTRAELEAKIEGMNEVMSVCTGHSFFFTEAVERKIAGYRAKLAALPEEPADGTHKLFVWTDHCTFAAVAHAKTVAQARELIEAEDLGGTDGSCPERATARKMIYDETPGIYRGAQAVLMFDTGNVEEPAPWTARERRMYTALERIGIGGNHLASALIHILGAGNDTFPPYSTSWDDAAKIIGDPINTDLWTCWAVMMLERDALSDTPPPDPCNAALEKAEKALEAFVRRDGLSTERDLLSAIKAAREGK